MDTLIKQVECVKEASRILGSTHTSIKNKALEAIADILDKNKELIFKENQKDVEAAKTNGMKESMLNRLAFTDKRFKEMTDGVRAVAKLPDPIGEVLEEFTRPNGLKITKVRVPFGVICAIFEARPNVSVDISALCLKTGNAVVLRGGKEALYTNTILVSLMKEAIKEYIPEDSILLVTGGHDTVQELITMRGLIDLCVPRGGKGLIRTVIDNALVPVIETGAGNCHLYVEKSADIGMSLSVALNAKAQRPAVCNSIETILVDRTISKTFLPQLKEIFDKVPVEIRGDKATQSIINCKEATDDDFFTEYDDYVVSIKVVEDYKEAVAHINKYGTHHSEAIMSHNEEAINYFLHYTDSACLYVNASTRFTDGGEFGFGAELGISNQKLHARGPMGLKEMTSYQYHIEGHGQIRQ